MQFLLFGNCEYFFGNRTMLAETRSICDRVKNGDVVDVELLRSCLLLLWAQRSRLPDEEKTKRRRRKNQRSQLNGQTPKSRPALLSRVDVP